MRGIPAEIRRPGTAAVAAKTLAVLRSTLRSRFAYLGESVLRCIFLLMILFAFTQLWKATGRTRDLLDSTGFSLRQLIWYLVFTEAIMLSAGSPTQNEVDREVRSGDLVYRLARPLAYPWFHLGSQMGERFLSFIVNLLAGSLIATVVAGPMRIHPGAAAAALILALVAMLCDWIWSFCISLLSFWFEDTFGLHLLYRRGQMILGGMMIPLSAYPDWLERIAEKMPFQYFVYQPARFFVAADSSGWLAIAARLMLLGAIGIVPLLLIYHLGLRRVAAQGG